MARWVGWMLLSGCTARVEPEPAAQVSEPAVVEREAVSPVSEPTSASPGDLYRECFDRVELPQAAGECASDADCATAGCGSEVCMPAVNAKDWMTTCEHRQCFSVLDTCRCVEGQCSWSLKAEVPPLGVTPPKPIRR